MATLETSPEANSDRRTGRQADRRKKPLIGARATALPENTAKQNMSSALHYGPNDRVKKKKIFIVISFR